MNIKSILLLLFVCQIGWGQNCDFEIRSLSNQLIGEFEIIEISEYQKVKMNPEKYIEFTPMSESDLIKKYPEIFKIKDSCYVFPANSNIDIGIKTTELKACKNKTQSKAYSNYDFKGVYCDNGLVQVQGYESSGFLSIDLSNGLTSYTMGKPFTSNGETAISYSNSYGEEEIALTDLWTKKQFVIGIEGWRTKESQVQDNVYYLKLESEFQTECDRETKYLKLRIKN
ncbi:hypothetical protein FF125_13575 [Aureibaculum algae]|uniref:Uncharacterized protein n=1 Tax=Aureibaculum algae TaxID=2584122 RepID=A0A5B7TWD4_9FLAO|nr:hypothetical protein [Aureibaculum algae]QCX39416.1 hypothetical protein FF125_13575 [Aureibaculum algae]